MSDDPTSAANDNASVQRVPVPAAPPEPMLPSPSGGGLLGLIERLSVNPNFNIETLNALLAARREEEDRAARRAFNAALASAKGEIEPILKKHEVDFSTSKGRTRYKHETLDDISRAVNPVFARYGLHTRFKSRQEGNRVFVSTILSHADGYTETTDPLEGVADPGSTSMNPFQALGSGLTYLARYSLRMALGLAAGADDDARAMSPSSPKVSADQANELERLFEETGSQLAPVLHLIGVDSIADMTVDQWTRAKGVIGLRKAQKKAANAPAKS
jgi:hypothetical protein